MTTAAARFLPIVFIAAIFLPVPVRAQADVATISGRIADPSGRTLADTVVRVTNVETNAQVDTLTNGNGVYAVRSLRPGPYRMLVERQGFKSIVLEDLTLDVGATLGRNFTMEIGEIKDTVTVTAGTEERSLSPAVSTVVNRQFIEQLPLNGRSFQSLIQLTPGILVAASGQGMEGQFTTGGQRTNSNYFTVDGVTVNFASNISVDPGQNFGGTLPAFTIGGGTNSFISVDAMQEFRTQTSSYSPEFGRAPGAQISIVSKSGTNQFHGTAYGYFRHESLDARNWFNQPPQPEPPLRQVDAGGTLGGPLLENRTFFFFSYEGLRLRQPINLVGQFYTQETRAAAAAVYQPFMQALPVPTGPRQDAPCDNVTTLCQANLTATSSRPTNFDAFSLRLDHTLNQRLTLFARGSHTPSLEDHRSLAGIEMARRDTDLVTGGMTAILSGALLNDVRVGWGRAVSGVDIDTNDQFGAVAPPTSAMFPPGTDPSQLQMAISFPGQTSVSMGRRAGNGSRQINVVNTFSAISRTHHLRFGIDYRRFEASAQGSNLYLVNVTTFDQLKRGTMASVSAVATDPVTAGVHNWSLFAQDTFNTTDRLTFTYGLRWEINSPPVSTNPDTPLYAIQGIFDTKPLELAPAGTPLWRTRYSNFAPRAGAAYQLDASTIVRGGFGLFSDTGYGGLLGRLVFGFPNARSLVTPTPGQPFDLSNPAFTPPPVPSSLFTSTQGARVAFDPQLQLPRTSEWNLATERELGAHQSIAVTYVGARGSRLLRPDYVVPPGEAPVAARRILVTRNAGSSRYDALQLQFQRRLQQGLQVLASYTLANNRDTESDDLGGNFTGASWNANSATTISQVHVPSPSPSDFDVRHAFSTAVSYELPSPSAGGIRGALLSDWALDAIVRLSTPPPLNVRIEGVSTELGVYRTQPDVVPGQAMWLPAPDQPGGRVLNPDAFTLPSPGANGNLPRNSIRSPFAIKQTDLSIRRRVRLNHTASLDFRVEFFNLFNHAMFGGRFSPVTNWGRCTTTPCTGQQTAGFGTVAGDVTLNRGLGGDPLQGGQSEIYAIGGPRSTQLSVKLLF